MVALKNDRAMASFVKRVAAELGYKITSLPKLNGVVPYYSGKKAKQSFKALKAELARTAKDGKKGWAAKKDGDTSHDEDSEEEENEENEEGDGVSAKNSSATGKK